MTVAEHGTISLSGTHSYNTATTVTTTDIVHMFVYRNEI
jgi:hypothetical protein